MSSEWEEYNRKYLAAARETKEALIWHGSANPPIFRMMRRFGYMPRAPHYIPFDTMFRTACIWFALGYLLIVAAILIRGGSLSVMPALVGLLIVPTAFAWILAMYYKWGRDNLGLTDWDEL